MLSKIVSLSLVALAAGQVQIEGSPEWQAYKNAELAHIAPSVGPVAPVNYAQSLLEWQAAQLAHQANAAALVAGHGRKKRQVQVVGSPEWQADKNAELAHIAPSTGPNVPGVNGNWAQSQLNWLAAQQAIVAAGAGRRKKRQVQVVGSPEWQAYKNAELAHIAPSTGPSVPGVVGNWAQSKLNWIASQQAIVAAGAGRKKRQATSWQENFVRPSQSWEANYHGQNNWQENFVRPSQSWEAAFVAGHGRRKRQTQAALDFVGPAPGPTAANFAQSALNFVAPAPGPTPVNFAQSSLDFVGPAPSNFAQAQLNFQQEALNFIARG